MYIQQSDERRFFKRDTFSEGGYRCKAEMGIMFFVSSHKQNFFKKSLK